MARVPPGSCGTARSSRATGHSQRDRWRTKRTFDADPGPGVVAHHDHPAYIAGAAAADESSDPSIVENVASLQQHGFLGDGAQVTSQVFQITRDP